MIIDTDNLPKNLGVFVIIKNSEDIFQFAFFDNNLRLNESIFCLEKMKIELFALHKQKGNDIITVRERNNK